MDNETLKQQFQLLQEQQQKKLQRLKQRKEERGKEKEKPVDRTSSAFGVEDDLGLELSKPPEPTNSIFSEELVNHLNEQIRELKDENGRVYKLLSERDFEIRQLKKKRDQDQAALAGGSVASETAASKIVDLSKKVRELTAEVEREKTKAKQYGKKYQDLQRQVDSGTLSLSGDGRSTVTSMMSPGREEKNTTEVKMFQEKLKQSELKQTEYRNQCQNLRQELKIAHKVLANEVGDSIPVQSLINANSGWRGRAQQILALQKKVTELKSQLNQQQQGSRADEYDLESEMLGTSTGSYTKKSTMEDRHKEQIKKLEKDRRDAQDKLANEMKALEEEHTVVKQKLDASKARNKVLSNEIKGNKEQMQRLLEKGKHDDELIEALMKNQERLKGMLEGYSQEHRKKEESQSAKLRELAQKTQQDTNIVEQLKAIVAEKESRVHALEDEIKQMRHNSIHKAQQESVNALFERSASQLSRPGTATIRPATATIRPASVVHDGKTVHTPSPPASRQSVRSAMNGDVGITELVERAVSRKSNRPASVASVTDTQTVGMMNELQLQVQEFKSLYQASEVERDKLLELVKVLQKRIDENSISLQQVQSDLMQHKKKNVTLEKQVGKLKVEQGQGSAGSKKGRSKQNSTFIMEDSSKTEPLSEENLEELQISLEIQKDENEALKAALQSTLQAKEEDLRVYTQMMEQTKAVFLEGLKQFRQQTQS